MPDNPAWIQLFYSAVLMTPKAQEALKISPASLPAGMTAESAASGEATGWFAGRSALQRTVIVGDLNIAPLEHDVWSHRQLLNVVSHTEPEVAGLLGWQRTGFVDAVRHFVPADEKLFTWWSYRNQDWRLSDRGRRLDHIWVTPDLQGGLTRHAILKDARDWTQPSDHVPVCVELAL